jgi:hypothetical protein
LTTNHTGEHKEPIGSIKQVVEHVYGEIQKGTIEPSPKVSILKMSVTIEDTIGT